MIVQFSGGVSSYIAAKRVAKFKPTLLFADTGEEDPDLFRFMDDAAKLLGLELVKLGGETLFECSIRHNALPNNRMPFCSKELKVERCAVWISEHAPTDTLVFGIGCDEEHRIPGIVKRWPGHECLFPLTDPPLLLFKRAQLDECRADGLTPPRLYDEGFPHNNCGGACVRGGQAAWRMLLDRRPETYARWEAHENMMREKLGKDIAILRDRRGKTTKPMTLTALRTAEDFDRLDFGGCGCFVD